MILGTIVLVLTALWHASRTFDADLRVSDGGHLAIVSATRLASAEVTGFFRLGPMASTGYNMAWSLALLGADTLPVAWDPVDLGKQLPAPVEQPLFI